LILNPHGKLFMSYENKKKNEEEKEKRKMRRFEISECNSHEKEKLLP